MESQNINSIPTKVVNRHGENETHGYSADKKAGSSDQAVLRSTATESFRTAIPITHNHIANWAYEFALFFSGAFKALDTSRNPENVNPLHSLLEEKADEINMLIKHYNLGLWKQARLFGRIRVELHLNGFSKREAKNMLRQIQKRM